MKIQDFQAQWNELGADDPMWAVLTDPDKTGKRWKPDEFFATGLKEIESIWQWLEQLQVTPASSAALDFGCGLGRLTQALCTRFEKCVGVDISESMVAGARRFNRFGERCEYRVNSDTDLQQFPDASFDFVFSLIALQHTPTRFQKHYVSDFLRILRPGGIACFQVARSRTLRRLAPDFAVERYRQWKHGKKPFISMYELAPSAVRAIAARHGATVVDSVMAPFGKEKWTEIRWCLRK